MFEETSEDHWKSLETDERFLQKLEEAEGTLQELLTSETRPQPELEGQDGVIAYFCAEFGLHESFPIYSGGLGILAGDHMKTASDELAHGRSGLVVPLWLRDPTSGRRRNAKRCIPHPLSHDLPLRPGLNKEENLLESGSFWAIGSCTPMCSSHKWVGFPFICSTQTVNPIVQRTAPLPETSTAEAWKPVSSKGSLGIGGFVPSACGVKVAGYHMNEGHAAFLGLELALTEMRNELSRKTG